MQAAVLQYEKKCKHCVDLHQQTLNIKGLKSGLWISGGLLLSGCLLLRDIAVGDVSFCAFW